MRLTDLGNIFLHPAIFVLGTVIGSFLNVCVLRLPQEKDIVKERSRCLGCGNALLWYELIPLLGFCLVRGHCRHCRMRLSWQYPCIEALNGVLYVWFFVLYGGSYTALIYGLVASVLIIIALVDWRTYEIPIGCNIAIGVLALLYLVTMILLPLRDTPFEAATMISQLTTHIAGFFAVSGLFWLIYVLSRGRAIGGGDVKLMAVAGLLLGWQLILLALMVAAVTGSVVHLLLMRLKGKDRVLAFGPYLAFGILVAMLGGEVILSWYIGGWG